MLPNIDAELPLALLDILPNPVLVKDSDLRYVWVNEAFEKLFQVSRTTLIGQLDIDVFPSRQVVQCNAGDKRVLASGEIDEAHETVFKDGVIPRITITRKSRLIMGEHRYLIGIMHDITDITEANKALEESKKQLDEQSIQLAEMAYTDALTGVYNRRRLHELASIIFHAHRNYGAVLLCDLDHFKRINDQWGHDAGDAALIHFVGIVKSVLREGDLVASVGGEEFTCLLAGTHQAESLAIAERIRSGLEKSPVSYKNQQICMTVSIGLSLLEGEEFNLDHLLSKADKGLYQAKESGRNQIVAAS